MKTKIPVLIALTLLAAAIIVTASGCLFLPARRQTPYSDTMVPLKNNQNH